MDLGEVVASVTAAGLWVSLCTILEFPDGSAGVGLNAVGQPNLTDGVPVTGLVDIPCMRAPLDKQTPYFGSEKRTGLAVAEEDKADHVLLKGWYPQIIPGMAAVVDGERLDIIVAESSSQGIITRMAVRRFSY